jgi:hypothetical protein
MSSSGGHQLSAHTTVTGVASEPPSFTLAQLSQLLQQISGAGNPSAPAEEGKAATATGKGAGNLDLSDFELEFGSQRPSIPGKGQKNNSSHRKSLAAHLDKTNINSEWIVDSGATYHMVNCTTNLANLTTLKIAQNVYLANGSTNRFFY